MDACDTVMSRMGRKPALIGYSTLRAESPEVSIRSVGIRRSIFRGRPAAYFSIIVALVVGLSTVLYRRKPVDFDVVRAVGAPYEEVLRAGLPSEVTNRFNVDLHNLTFSERSISVSTSADTPGIEIVSNGLPANLAAGEQRRISMFLKFSKDALRAGGRDVALTITSRDSVSGLESKMERMVRVVGPY
jgi:polyferredoxin